MAVQPPRILVTQHGPLRVEGAVAIYDAQGTLRTSDGIWHLCRCGGSRNKPFCDATHGLKEFDGAETATRDAIAHRRSAYPTTTNPATDTDTGGAGGVLVYDDRSRCAHFGQCTDRLGAVFRAAQEPFVDATAAPPDQVVDVVRGCPSGALAYAIGEDPSPVEERNPPSIHAIVDGPYRIHGVPVIGADGEPYEVRERQTLCRCGKSRNKPYCDGSHWYAGFRDPLPVEMDNAPSMYEWLGGLGALERLTTRFYADILNDPDPLLEPVFRGMDAEHPLHVAAWLAETFGGPRLYTEEHGGYEHMIAQHLNRHLTDEQRERWVARLVTSADLVDLPDDPDFRASFLGYLEWGSRIAVFNSTPGIEIIAHAPVPRWGWGNSATAAAFWAGLLDRQVATESGSLLAPGDNTQVGLRFSTSQSARVGRPRPHLHLTSDSLEDQWRTVATALRLAGHLDVGQTAADGFVVLADPGGNELCVVEPGNKLSGRQLVWDENEQTAIQSPLGGTKISWDSWGEPPAECQRRRSRQRFDLVSVDPTSEAERLVSLGATYRAHLADHVELADPDGIEFSLRAD